MDKLGIPDYVLNGDKRTAPKDLRIEGQQRCMLISGESSRRRRREYLEKRELKKTTSVNKRKLTQARTAKGS